MQKIPSCSLMMSEDCTMVAPNITKGVSYCIRRGLAAAFRATSARIPIYGVVFDLDGTLTIPVLDFAKLRQKLNCPHPNDILKFVESKPEGEREEARRIIEEFEEEGRNKTKLQPHVADVLKFLSEQGLKRALVTRNAQPSVDQFLSILGSPDGYGGPFTHLLTRNFTPTKPDPAPVLHICKEWGVEPCSTVMVGDHLHDIQCGRDAGSVTILLNNKNNKAYQSAADFSVDSLEEIIDLFRQPFTVDRLQGEQAAKAGEV